MLLNKRNSLEGGFSSFAEIIENVSECVRLTKLKYVQSNSGMKSFIALCEDYGPCFGPWDGLG